MEVLGKLTGLTPRYLYGDFKDTHIYTAHLDAVRIQLSREPLSCSTKLELPDIRKLSDLRSLTADDFKLLNYEHLGAIKAPLLVG